MVSGLLNGDSTVIYWSNHLTTTKPFHHEEAFCLPACCAVAFFLPT